ncbi:MAG: cation:proton antiporter [Gemmatimonadales bacterium]
MNPIVVVVLLVLIGLLGAQLTFARRKVPLGPRISIAIGLPFLFVGFALGPHLLEVLSHDIVERLNPMLALGLGWIGLLFGLQLDPGHLRQFPARYLVLAWLQAGVAFGIVFLIGYLIADAWFSLDLGAVVLVAAATACVSTPAAIALISNTYGTRGRVTRLLFYIASLDAAVGIVALGLTNSAYRAGVLGARAALSLFEWFAISVLLGIFFGILFLSLTRIRPRTKELLLLLIGLVLFAAGTAFYLSLSPLFICMIAGAVIGNLSPMRRRVYTALSEWEQPIYVIMLVLAGALLEFSTWWILPLVAAYAGLRILAKWLGGLLASKLPPPGLTLPGTFGLALTPQGGISLAIAISFVLVYNPTGFELSTAVGLELSTAISVFFATVVIAVGISDLIGPFLVRAVLERAGELDGRPASAAAAAID